MSVRSGEGRPGSTIYRLGVDIGGTFTDIILLGADGSILLRKVPSTPADFSAGVIAGLSRLLDDSKVSAGQVTGVLHGTTVAANAILEERGAPTGLITTRGFRDVLEIGRLRRPALYDISWVKPRPLVPRRWRFELDFRITPEGDVDREPDPGQIEEVMDELQSQGIQSVAACFINSYARPDVERKVADLLRRRVRFVTASVDVSPEIKEYERTSTAVVNAYVRPVVAGYVDHLARRLVELGVHATLLIMQSSGGLMDAGTAQEKPAYMIESGPAAGVTATRYLARRVGMPNAIAFDMGGTTAKASLVEAGEPFESPEYEAGGGMNARHGLITGSGYVLRTPSIDIAEVGAGGGSICWIDAGGAPRVGPQSAGADPGPACYGRGGDRPTLTDAQVLLGYLDPSEMAGGVQAIDAIQSDAVFRGFAEALGLSLHEAAYGACMIGVHNMSRAVKAVSSQRGRDPRDFVLIAFGGAGPAYAVEMARVLGVRRVLVPQHPGLFCSIGLLAADVHYNEVRTHTRPDLLDPVAIGTIFDEMEAAIAATVLRNGHQVEEVERSRLADVHYRGQSSELRIPMGSGRIDDADLRQLRADFDAEHERTYGHRGDGQQMEVAALRLRATIRTGEADRENLFAIASPVGVRRGSPERSRLAYFGGELGLLETPVIDRHRLGTAPTPGPLIVQEMDATTVVPPGASAVLDEFYNILIRVE